MEMREALCREGRDAKNLLAYQLRDDKPLALGANFEKNVSPPLSHRKPPKSPNALLPSASLTPKKTHSPSRHSSKQSTGPRVRSASTGRDKKSELQARYWALLFGNLQRAVNEIYQTVECYENISSCQEAILVLENYVRDFKALSEWFKVSGIMNLDPSAETQFIGLGSPTVSGKSSPCPCNSGKSSPCLGNLDQHSPRKGYRVNVRELFASSKRHHVDASKEFEPQNQDQQLPPLSPANQSNEGEEATHLILENRSHQYAQTDLEDDHLTLAGIREKMQKEQEEREAQLRHEEELKRQQEQQRIEEEEAEEKAKAQKIIEEQEKNEEIAKELSSVEMTIQKLDDMENAFLSNNINKDPTPPDTVLKKIQSTEEKTMKAEKSTADVNKKAITTPSTAQNSPLKYSSVLNRPAATINNNLNVIKPANLANGASNQNSIKTVANTKASTLRASIGKPNAVVPPAKSTIISTLKRSATTASAPSTKPPFSGGKALPRNGRCTLPPRVVNNKTDNFGPPSNVASRLSARSRTMIEMNQNDGQQKTGNNLKRQSTITSRSLNNSNNTNLSSHRASRDDLAVQRQL
ncbi:hypothetical protein DOY81_010251 [Sarcophaga bullata]|nr:hypothetical protein DOY81_010251 [Sarcophaga bullata]